MKASNYVADPILVYAMPVDQKGNSSWLFDKHKLETNIGQGSGLTFYEGGHGKSCIDTLIPQAKALGACAGMPPTNLWVNQEAIRFMDESIVRQATPCSKSAEIQGNVFSIMDQSGFDKYAADGCQTHHTGFADKLVGQPIPTLAADFSKYTNFTDVFTAPPSDELAKKNGN